MLGLFETVIGAVTTHSTKTAISGTLLLIIVGLIHRLLCHNSLASLSDREAVGL